MHEFSLVNQLWVIVPVNPWKNRVSSELLYLSNRPHFLEKFVNHEPAACDLQTFLVFSQTSRVGYYPYKPTESVVCCLIIFVSPFMTDVCPAIK